MNGGPSGEVTLLTALVSLGLSAFFSGCETGFMSVSRARLRARGSAATPRGRRLEGLLARIEDPILTCLIGTNLFNVLGSAVVTAALAARFGPQGEWLALLVVSTTVILWGEIVPKVLYREFPERLTLVSVPGIRVAMAIAAPLRAVLRGYVALWRRLLPAAAGGETLDRRSLASLLMTNIVPADDDRRFAETLDRFVELAGQPLSELAQPVDRLQTVPPDATVGDCLRVAAGSGFSRLPVTSEDGRVVQGYVLVRDLLFLPREDHDLAVPRRLRRSILLVDGRMDAYELFEEMRSQARQLAVITDADGNPRGLITLEDLIETVVGSIADEFDFVEAAASAASGGSA